MQTIKKYFSDHPWRHIVKKIERKRNFNFFFKAFCSFTNQIKGEIKDFAKAVDSVFSFRCTKNGHWSLQEEY